MHIRTLIGLAAALVLGCGSPEDAFVGAYSGTYECVGSFDDGSQYEEGPGAQTIRIEQAIDGSVYLAGMCTIPLDVIGMTRAEVRRTACTSVLPNGSPIDASVDSGVIDLREPKLSYSLRWRFSTSGWTANVVCTFDGTRIE